MTGVRSPQPVGFQEASDCAGLVPPVGDRIIMPADFGRRFVIFADAEEEFDWRRPFNRANVSTTAIKELISATARFNAAGVYPSYLVDYPVVDNPQSAGVIRMLVESGSADVGTQLHPWVTPPFTEDVNEFNSFTGNLPLHLQREKLEILTRKITDAVGVQPTTYRAGRYGLGAETMRLLGEAGYQMDVSVRSHFDYSDRKGVDYRLHPLWPWRVNDQLIELPLTTGWTGALNRHPSLFENRWLRGTLARTGMLSRIPLTPEGVPLSDALEAIAVLNETGLEIFSLSFHTPSVVVGHTPYVRSDAELATFWAWWDGVFNAFAKLGITPVRQNEIIAAADRAR